MFNCLFQHQSLQLAQEFHLKFNHLRYSICRKVHPLGFLLKVLPVIVESKSLLCYICYISFFLGFSFLCTDLFTWWEGCLQSNPLVIDFPKGGRGGGRWCRDFSLKCLLFISFIFMLRNRKLSLMTVLFSYH